MPQNKKRAHVAVAPASVSHILEIALVGLHPPKKYVYVIGGSSQEGEEKLWMGRTLQGSGE